MDPVSRWKTEVEKTVANYARNHSYDQKQDLKQECYLGILESQESINALLEDDPVKARRYVIQICRNKIKMDVREKAKNAGLVPILADDEHADTHPLVASGDLIDCLNHLDGSERYVLDSIFFRGMTIAEVAESVGRSERWVKMRKKEALETARRLLEKK